MKEKKAGKHEKEQEKRGKGRPPELTAEQVRVLADSIGIGMSDESACARAEVDYEYFDKNWRNLKHLYGAIKKAKADREYHRLESVDQGLPGWQSSAWMLERTNPRYRLNSQDIKITNTNTASVSVDSKAIKEAVLQAQRDIEGFDRGSKC